MRELYAEYRDFANPKGKPRFADVEDELKLIEHYAPLYETLEGRRRDDDDLAWFGRKMAAWQVTTVYPIAMQLGAIGIDQSTRHATMRALYSYLVRRAVCGLTTKNLNNVFQGLAAAFHSDGPSIDALKAYFADKPGDSTRFPDDTSFTDGFVNGNAYAITPQPRLVDILWELELASRSNLSEDTSRPARLWVEHVLPQTWTEEWPLEGGEHLTSYSPDPRAVARRAALSTFGNLTLVKDGLNISSGNKSFNEKKAKFAEHTGLFLNKWFATREAWNESKIVERGTHLAAKARQIWPSLDSF